MEFSKELIEKAKTAKTAEELLELVKAEGVELSKEEAAKYFAELNKSGELSDDELNNVAGGCAYESGDTPKFSVGQRIEYKQSVFVIGWGSIAKYHDCTVIKILPKEDKVFIFEIELDDGKILTVPEYDLSASGAV